MKTIRGKNVAAGVKNAFGVCVKPESYDDWMIRGETVDGKFVPDFVPVDADKPTWTTLTSRYAEKHFSSFAAAANFCKGKGWVPIEGY